MHARYPLQIKNYIYDIDTRTLSEVHFPSPSALHWTETEVNQRLIRNAKVKKKKKKKKGGGGVVNDGEKLSN